MADETKPTEDPSELRKAAEEGAKARREAEMLRRENAFLRAGIPTDTKPAKALLETYSGELDVEAIKAEAAEWGLLKQETAPEPTPDPEPDRSAERELQDMRDAASGAPAPQTEPQVDAYKQVFKDFESDREQGFSQTDATNRAIGRLIQKAAAGDPTAIFNQDAWEEKAALEGHGAKFAK